jgi:hypothetical protein
MNMSTKNTLSEINRDESARLLWTVLRRQPRLALLGLRGLLLGRTAAPRNATISAPDASN